MCAPLCGRRDDFFPALRFWTAVYIMRHRTIETTLKYYVELDAGETAAELWKAIGDPFGDTRPVRASDRSPARQKARRK